ncbi:MAG: tRNA (guanosine(37)-N1)-methyltransferase TrmD [Magnetovibrionaceae bacterium]
MTDRIGQQGDGIGNAQSRVAWDARVLTIFPEMFPGSLGLSLAGQALDKGIWSLSAFDIRDYAFDRHRSVDDSPFGGGAGMVMRADVVQGAIDAARADRPDLPLVYLSPRGKPLAQTRVRELADGPGVIVLCGRFEGVDERVLEENAIEEISLGDFVLSGGEPAAISLLDACVRLLPGVMGHADSGTEESFEDDLLEYPHYTRPQVWRDRSVPEILLSGHHGRVYDWRKAQAQAITKARRPDLWRRYATRHGLSSVGPEPTH